MILYTSDIEKDKKKNAHTAVTFLAVTAFCGFFSSVYFKYSHGVSSDYMVFLSAVPFMLGVLPYTFLKLCKLYAPPILIKHIYNCGVATVTVGFALNGIFEIYGGECAYTPYYFSLGALLIVTGALWYIIKAVIDKKRSR